jgi:ERCC4-related helicase
MTPTEMVMVEMKEEIEKLRRQLEVAKDALNKIKAENKSVDSTGGIESKDYWFQQEIKSRTMASRALDEIKWRHGK